MSKAAIQKQDHLTAQGNDLTLITPRQREILIHLCNGRTNAEIARFLDLSTKTVDAHRAAIMTRLRINSLALLVRFAIRNKLIEA